MSTDSGEYTLRGRQGDTYVLSVKWADDNEDPVDLTGASVEFGMAPGPGASPSFQYSEDDYMTVTPASGLIEIEIPYTETRKWSGRRYLYELTVLRNNEVRTTLLHGRFNVSPEYVV